MRAVFADANDTLPALAERLLRDGAAAVSTLRDPSATPGELPGLKHAVFLGIGARGDTNPDDTAECGITVSTIKGHGEEVLRSWPIRHVPTTLENVPLSAYSAFRMPEAALDHYRGPAAAGC